MKKFLIICLLLSLFGCQQTSEDPKVNDDTNDVVEIFETKSAKILSMDGSVITCASEDYDRDEYEKFVDSIYTLEVLDDAVYWEVFRNVVEKDGVQTVDETSQEITHDAFVEMLDYGSVFVYLDVNSSQEVVKITVWGEIIVYE